VSALPQRPVKEPERRARPVVVASPPSRRRHGTALAAGLAYAAAAVALALLVLPALEQSEPRGSGIGADAALQSPAAAPGELLAMRALAARAQASVYVVEAGSGRGSGFVAWSQPARGRTFLLTAHAVVAGLLAEGGRTVYVSRGGRFWTGRLWAADRRSGVALIRLDTVLTRPLWQDDDQPGALTAGGKTFVVPPGQDIAFGESDAQPARAGRFRLAPGYDPLYVGAPVVNAEGNVGGVVVAAHPNGSATVVPLAAACDRLRRCSSD
jgi:hypothetical protein